MEGFNAKMREGMVERMPVMSASIHGRPPGGVREEADGRGVWEGGRDPPNDLVGGVLDRLFAALEEEEEEEEEEEDQDEDQ